MKLQDISELYRGYEDKVIDGKKIGGEIEETVKTEVKRYTEQYGSVPTLGTVLVGEDPPSQLYVKLKHWACKRVGIKSQNYHLEESASEKEVIEVVDELNLDDGVNGILVQMPLPNHIDQSSIMQLIDPLKDVDGFNPLNMGRLMQGDESWLVACTPRGIIEALDYYDIDIEGQHVVIVGHSNIVGKPMAALFMNRNATVSVCHVYTKDLSAFTRDADILVVATGVKGLIRGDMVKEGSVVFDVGITWIDNKVYGDVRFPEVVDKVKLISPVPGGVGPLTIAVLMRHTIKAAWTQAENRHI